MKYVRNESETHMNEVDGRERERERERKKKDTSKCGDCHCIRILRLSADVYTSQKGPVEQSFSTRFISLTYVLSLSLFFLISLVHIQLMSEGANFKYSTRR